MKQKWHCGRPCTFAYCQLGETVELHWVRFSNDCSEGDALCSGLALLAGCLRPLTRWVAHHISLAVICCHECWDCRHECKTPNCRKNRKICEVFKEQCYTLLPCLTRFEIQGFYCFILLYNSGNKQSKTKRSEITLFRYDSCLWRGIFVTIEQRTQVRIARLSLIQEAWHVSVHTMFISTVSQRIEKTTEERLKLALYAGVKSWCRGICKDSQVVITS